MSGNYCLVEDGKVTYGPAHLPKTWKNISGLHRSTDAELKTLGWLPFAEVDPPYDTLVYWRDTPTVDIQSDKVVYNQVLVAYTAQEVKQNAWNTWVSTMDNADEPMDRNDEDLMDMVDDIDPAIIADDKYKSARDRRKYRQDLRATRPPKP